MSRERSESTWRALAGLPCPDLPREGAERILRTALSALEPPPPAVGTRPAHRWTSALEAALLALAGTGWLAWLGGQVLALAR